MEINRSAAVMSDLDFNQIRQKAIQFGSAIEPQNARVVLPALSKEQKRARIQAEIGSAVDTKALQNTLQSALAHKFGAKKTSKAHEEEEEEEKKVDLDKYGKMLALGVAMDAVLLEMSTNSVSQAVVEQFAIEHGGKREAQHKNKATTRNALLTAIDGHGHVAPIVPAGPPTAVGAPPPVPTGAMGPPPLVPPPAPAPAVMTGYGVSNGMINSSRIPTAHSNAGLSWQRAIDKQRRIMGDLKSVRRSAKALDRRLHRGDAHDEDDEDDEEEEEKGKAFMTRRLPSTWRRLSAWSRRWRTGRARATRTRRACGVWRTATTPSSARVFLSS